MLYPYFKAYYPNRKSVFIYRVPPSDIDLRYMFYLSINPHNPY